MRYLLLMYHAEGAFTEEELPQEMAGALEICHELHARNSYVDALPLHSAATAKSVRVRNFKPAVTDGPFAETKEQLGGYVLIDVENLDEAIKIASRFPAARRGTVEIRPIVHQ